MKAIDKRTQRALYALAAAQIVRVHHHKTPGLLYLAAPEGRGSSVLLYHLDSGKWQDKKLDGEGSGLFAAMRRLGIPLELVTAALVGDALHTGDE